MTNNIEVHYIYRDGGNNKNCQSVVIANPDGITPEQLEKAIRSRFSDLQVWPDILHFQPETLGWPTAYFSGHDLNGEDLTVHEIDQIELTSAQLTTDSDVAGIVNSDREKIASMDC